MRDVYEQFGVLRWWGRYMDARNAHRPCSVFFPLCRPLPFFNLGLDCISEPIDSADGLGVNLKISVSSFLCLSGLVSRHRDVWSEDREQSYLSDPSSGGIYTPTSDMKRKIVQTRKRRGLKVHATLTVYTHRKPEKSDCKLEALFNNLKLASPRQVLGTPLSPEKRNLNVKNKNKYKNKNAQT